MELIKKYGIAVFWIFLVIDCLLCVSDSKDLTEYRLFINPLLIPILALYFYTNTKRSKHPRTKALLYTGLFLCWAGDVALMWYDVQAAPNSYIFMIIAIALICLGLMVYVKLFNKMHNMNIKDCQEAFLATLGMTALNAFLFKVLKLSNTESYKYGIILEMLLVTIFVAFAVNVYRNKLRRNIATKKMIPGAIVLALSMYIILAHKFLLDQAGFLPGVFMLTFGFGQMQITQGFKDYLKA
jgi:hypothetical protein